MLDDIVPSVTVEDLQGVISFAIERHLTAWEDFSVACVEYERAHGRPEGVAEALALRLDALGRVLYGPGLAGWTIKAVDEGFHVHPAVLEVAATEPLNWRTGFDVDTLSARVLLLANAKDV